MPKRHRPQKEASLSKPIPQTPSSTSRSKFSSPISSISSLNKISSSPPLPRPQISPQLPVLPAFHLASILAFINSSASNSDLESFDEDIEWEDYFRIAQNLEASPKGSPEASPEPNPEANSEASSSDSDENAMDLDDQPIRHRRGYSQQNWIEASKTIKAREKLVRILKGEAYVPKQH